MGLIGIVRFKPLQKPESEEQHVGPGFLDGGLGGTGDFAAECVKLLVIEKHRETIRTFVGLRGQVK
jgi:hypothetical protein